MRYSELNELMGVRKFANMSSDQILSFVDKNFGGHDIKFLGQGGYGAAVEIKGAVYKLWIQDSAYQAFVEYSLKNQGNPFLPKFSSGIKSMPAFFMRHPDAPDRVNYVKMEKLSPMKDLRSVWFKVKDQPRYDSYEDEDEDFTQYSISLHHVLEIIPSMGRSVVPYVTDFAQRLGGRNSGVRYDPKDFDPALVQFLETIHDLMELSRNFDLDLHSGNFMMRGNQLVILDPIASPMDSALNRKFSQFNQGLNRGDERRTSVASPANRSPGTST